MSRLLERLPPPSVRPSRREEVAGIAFFLAVTVVWTLWVSLPDWDPDASGGLTNPFDLGGPIAAVLSAVSVVVTGYLIGRAVAAVWLGWIPGALMMAVGFLFVDKLGGLVFLGGLLLIFGWPLYFLPLIGVGVGLRSWHAKGLASPRLVNRRLLLGLGAAVVAAGVLGAAFYSTDPDSSDPVTAAAPPPAGPLCTREGVRYAGTTAEGAEVCFTLAADRSEWLEIGVSFVSASGCPNSATGTVHKGGSLPITAGRFTVEGFTATVRGNEASGELSDAEICGRKTFKWNARREP